METTMYALPRISTAAALALVTTASLFYLMKTLITSDAINVEPVKTFIIEIVKPLEMNPVIPIVRSPTPPPKPETTPPKPEISFEEPGIITLGPNVTEPVAVIKPDIAGVPDGQQLPLVRIQPNYPRKAMSQGIEGFTIVEFDLNEHGSVENPRIIESYPSTIFDRASLKAIQKFKFKPKVVNSKAQRVTNLRNRFRFELNQG